MLAPSSVAAARPIAACSIDAFTVKILFDFSALSPAAAQSQQCSDPLQ
jgi:hypothetical protein